MLVIPLEGKISWRNPPVVTLALIAINCFVFFVFQSGDAQLISHRYGLVPAQAKPWMFVTMMFLHGGLGHLIGNMIFLWIVGCVLEMGLGRILYGLGYILVGIFAAAVYFVVHHSSDIPTIGASGAISGLMGALTVLYGTTRIRVFFSTGFYFDYFRMPAVLLLPFWLGKELLAFYLGAAAGVAYMAHAGGLIGGALLGIAGKQSLDSARKAYFEETLDDPTPALIEEAMEKMSNLDFDGARPLLQKAVSLNPANLDALGQLFHLEKQAPGTDRFHEAARRYLSALVENTANYEKTHDVYRQYIDLAGRPGLPTHLYARLASVFIDAGEIDAGKKIVVNLIRYRPNMEVIPALLLRLINALERRGMMNKSQKYRKILRTRYPHSQEARIAAAKKMPHQDAPPR